jgi:rRNA processing protein Gar1
LLGHLHCILGPVEDTYTTIRNGKTHNLYSLEPGGFPNCDRDYLMVHT